MTTAVPQIVVFDIGNVLVEWHPLPPYDARIGEARRRALFEAVPLMAMNDAVDAGAVLADEVERLAADHPDWAEEVRLWPELWPEMFAPVIPHSVQLLRALRSKGVPVWALTNFGDATFAVGQAMYPFLTEFDGTFVSGRMRAVKPDAAIYAPVEEAAAGMGMAPDALLFADDRPENVDAATARGWRGHLFEGPQGLAERLVAEGLLSAAEAVA